MGEAGYDLVRNHFGWDRIADQMLTVYTDALGKSKTEASRPALQRVSR
jgi:hypothetical protein